VNVHRVALVSFHTCPLAKLGEGKAGGMNSYVRELAKRLARAGVRVDIFTRQHGGHEPQEVELAPGATVVHLPGGPGNPTQAGPLYLHLGSFTEAMLGYATKRGADYALIHAHYWLSGEVARRAARVWNAPMAATFHTLARTKEQALAAEEPPPRAQVESEVVREAARIIATTPHEKESLVRLYGALPDRVEVAPCGVDLDLFRPVERVEARRTLGIGNEKVVLFVGRLERIKGVELLLRTAAIMDGGDSARVLVVGGEQGGEGEAARLKALARELGIQGRVRFVGRVEQAALPTYYSAADVCVVPSYYESFGLAALEAMACGTPVVAARVGGLPWVVQHNRTGYLVPWHCPEPFANWLETLLSSDDLRRKMGAAAYQFAQSMGWEQVSARILGIYESLLTAGKVKAASS